MKRHRWLRLLLISVAGPIFIPTAFLAQQASSPVRSVRLCFVSGTVTVERPGSAAGVPAQVDTPIEEGFAVSTSALSLATVVLEDGSTIQLSELSRALFTSLSVDAKGNRRSEVKLEQGAATFDFNPTVQDFYLVRVANIILTPNSACTFGVSLLPESISVSVLSGSIDTWADSQMLTADAGQVLTFIRQSTGVPASTTPPATGEGHPPERTSAAATNPNSNLLEAIGKSEGDKGTTAPGPAPVIAVSVKVVNVPATVRDKKGAIVRNLNQNDFELKEDDRTQTISYFSQETDLPLSLGLMVDTSPSQQRVLGKERAASAAFLSQVLRADKDRAFIIRFDEEVRMLPPTSSQPRLQAALNLMQGPRGRSTRLYDAIYLASENVMKKQQGRKALIVLTDGVDEGSRITLAHAIAAAQRTDTLVYSILFSDDLFYGGGSNNLRRGKKVLEQLSQETGGRFFQISRRHPLEETFRQIQEDLRSQYSLAYTPDPSDAAGYHKITLTVKEQNLTVQAREGYYSGP